MKHEPRHLASSQSVLGSCSEVPIVRWPGRELDHEHDHPAVLSPSPDAGDP
jgi:hypothetical protein